MFRCGWSCAVNPYLLSLSQLLTGLGGVCPAVGVGCIMRWIVKKWGFWHLLESKFSALTEGEAMLLEEGSKEANVGSEANPFSLGTQIRYGNHDSFKILF